MATLGDSVMWVAGVCWLAALASYVVPQVWLKVRGEQDLKAKYGAKWALVTGGSSGIGRAVAERLAKQGISVVVAAFPDAVLESAVKEMQLAHPGVEVRKVGVDLSSRDFMTALAAATDDVDVQVVVNNAGYIKTGLFAAGGVGAQLANHDVNATAAVEITHHYLTRMQAKGLRGCITFTSSPAGFMPCPTSVLYGATKAFLTTFAQSLAPEVRADGIDVAVLHPSPVASRFYEKTHRFGAIEFMRGTATGPEVLAGSLLAGVGRSVTIDQGYYPMCVKVLLKVLDVNFLADVIAAIAQYLPDFKLMKAEAAKETLAK